MQRLFTHTIGLRVVHEATSAHLGTVSDVRIDAATGVILALQVRQGFLLARTRYVLLRDIRAWDGDTVHVADVGAVCPAVELVRFAEQLSASFSWLRLPVRTVAGVRIGRIADVAFDPTLGVVTRLMVNDTLLGLIPGGTRIIGAEHIVAAEPTGITIDDDVARVRGKRRMRLALPVVMPADAPPA